MDGLASFSSTKLLASSADDAVPKDAREGLREPFDKLLRVEIGDITPERSKGDLVDDSGGVGSGAGEEVRENVSRRRG